jgi:DNA-damage-inducible protein J
VSASYRIRPDIKTEAESIIHDLGLSVSTAFELFYRQIILHRGLPFDVRIPNVTTRRAIENARKGHGERRRIRGRDFEVVTPPAE